MSDTTVQALAATPQVTVSGMLIFGYPLDSWVLVATGIYTVLLLFALVRDKYFYHYFGKGKSNDESR